VPNDSYRFGAVLPLEGYVLNVADIKNAIATLYINHIFLG
jgi:hypothetical protein